MRESQVIFLPSGRRLSTSSFDKIQLAKSYVRPMVGPENKPMEIWELRVERDEFIFISIHASMEECELSAIAFVYFIEQFSKAQ